ncbi:LicD family protein [Lentilactobacillus sp. Marseille-Q4993]|uniref:LicD family protein n=1 Tax=Lentilactobacillus sp. Marseille-Q4993 TaxID=3039492 RepID=UPI0024BC24A3|nr:LicD family protein [Lentilactobacillus sp. Marseille-Q4993]
MVEITNKVQQIELNSFKKLSSILDANGIPYYAIGGTLLGAIRHQGFIPWDDDMDIALLRPDYEKLLVILPEILINDHYFLQTPFSDENYALSYAKLLDRNTYIEEKNNYNDAKKGVFIDIFPIDNIPESQLRRQKQITEIKRLDSRLYLKLRYNFIDNPIKKLYSPLSSEQLDTALEFKHNRERAMKTYNNLKDHFALKNLASQYDYEKELFTETELGTPLEVPFEDTTIKVPAEYSSVLTRLYGDYNELPPENQQNSKHITRLIYDNQEFLR